MEKQLKKKFTWKMNNVSFSQLVKIYSDQFLVGGCKWRLCARLSPECPSLDLILEVAEYGSLDCGWRRHARFSLYPVEQNLFNVSEHYEDEWWFDKNSYSELCETLFPLKEFIADDGRLLINGELNIVLEIEVLEVVGEVDVTEVTSTITETMDVNFSQLHYSQVGVVNHMFEKHPEVASEFRSNNPNLRTGFMSLLLSLVETVRQSSHELPKDDLAVAYAALESMTEAGFKLDWLEKKLDDLSKIKEKKEAGETRMQEIENELKDLKLKYSDLEAELEKEKSEVLAAEEPISLDYFI
ncbi:unnamed protein product [Eruca vesicaria subsp. sativa]|uniref:MATH domain-containing protein n=1 Tax=Eruca vesicaria subsp. sativa TaxID=29727 RepID=A0ABC8JGC9_ERUVS|nr:unnamed protein product [Eruca vesicaria subsp. sativa]